jgi:hypothetical protein
MDQEAFRHWRDLNPCTCPFEHAILTNRCHCPLAKRLCIGEREAIECQSPEALSLCEHFLATLKNKARFTLKRPSTHQDTQGPLPQIKGVHLQVGGLRGLQRIRHPDTDLPRLITDIHGLIKASLAAYSSLDELPWTLIIHEVANYQDDKRRSRRQDSP